MKSTTGFCLLVATVVLLPGCGLLPPFAPEEPCGPDSGNVGELLVFSAVTTDPDGQDVSFCFDWGDGTRSDWTRFVPGGQPVQAFKCWADPGTYKVRAQARDPLGMVSCWSAAHSLAVARRPGGYPDEVVGTVSTGVSPFSLCVLPDGRYVYVCNRDGTVSVVCVRTLAVVATVRTGTGTAFCCALPGSDFVYVTDEDRTVHVVRTRDNSVVAQVTVGAHPLGIAAAPDGRHVYVGNWDDGTVSVIRTADNTVVATVECGMHPWGLTVSPDGQYLYTGNGHTDDVSVIRTLDNTLVANVPIAHGPGDNAITPDGRWLWQSCGYNHVGVVDLRSRSVSGYVPFGTYAQG